MPGEGLGIRGMPDSGPALPTAIHQRHPGNRDFVSGLFLSWHARLDGEPGTLPDPASMEGQAQIRKY